MTDEEFSAGVDQIISTSGKSHSSHRRLDELWTRYALEKGGLIAAATQRWMDAIEGDHSDDAPYPLGWRTAWTMADIGRAKDLKVQGLTYRQIGFRLKRSGQSVRRRLQAQGPVS
jgi:hypothetical protein